MADRSPDALAALQATVADLVAAARPDDVDPGSLGAPSMDVAPDEVAPDLLARIRQLPDRAGTHGRVRALAEATRDCLLDAVTLRSTSLADRLGDLLEELGDLSEVLGGLQRRVGALDARSEDLETRLAALEAAEDDRRFRPWFSSQAFEDEFRGTRDRILDRYHDLADTLAEPGGPVLDLGCGRGELLELLRDRGVPARGVEVVPELVELCTEAGLDVGLADAAAALAAVDDASLGGVALIQVVEHVSAQQLVDLVATIGRKVRPGGVVVAETVNAVSPYVFTRSFYLDPTHTNPVHHAYLMFLFRQAGFAAVDVDWRSPVPPDEMVPAVPAPPDPTPDLAAVVAHVNASVHALNDHLFPPQDYAVIARR